MQAFPTAIQLWQPLVIADKVIKGFQYMGQHQARYLYNQSNVTVEQLVELSHFSNHSASHRKYLPFHCWVGSQIAFSLFSLVESMSSS
jgi:hypothetical protein